MKLKSIFAIVVVFLITSCNKNDHLSSSFEDINELSLEHSNEEMFLDQDTTNILDAVDAVKDFANIDNINVYALTQTEKAQIGNEIITNSVTLLNSHGISNQELINVFGSIDHPHIGAIGLMISAYEEIYTINSSSSNPCESKIKIIRCLVSAALPCTILTTALNALTGKGTEMTTEWALGVINDVLRLGVNYATPQGVALMAADFTVCMIFTYETPEEPTDPTFPTEPIYPSNSISGMGQTIYNYGDLIDRMENYLNGYEEPIYNTIFYYLNGKYYSDAQKSKLLPNGFYSTSFSTVYRIENGELVHTYNLTACPSCPYPMLPPISDPFANGPEEPILDN